MSWPTNKPFRKFAALVADGVQFALGRGKRITVVTLLFMDRPDCRCPLGAALELRGSVVAFPGYKMAARVLHMNPKHTGEFIEAFEGTKRPSISPYFKLGQAYRQRFIEGRFFDTSH